MKNICMLLIEKVNQTEAAEEKEQPEEYNPYMDLYSGTGKSTSVNQIHQPLNMSEQMSKKIYPIIEEVLNNLVVEKPSDEE